VRAWARAWLRGIVPLLLLGLTACGDNLQNGPDAPVPQPPDAPQIDARVPDAGPPPDAPEIPADDPCTWIPSEELDAVPNYPIRFGNGQGLEISPDIRQVGLLELSNAHLDNRDVIEKRRGAVQLGDSRSTTPGDDVPDDDRRAIWARGNEVLLETHDAIYQERRAATAFVWGLAASWIRMRLREDYANTFASDVIQADAVTIGDAVMVGYQISGGPTILAAYGPSFSRELLETLQSGGTRVRLSSPEDFVNIAYQDQGAANFPIRLRQWVPANNASTTVLTPIAVMPAAAGVWDMHSAKTSDDDVVTAIAAAAPTADDMTVFVAQTDQAGTIGSATLTVRGGDLTDVAVAVWPVRNSGEIEVVTAELLSVGGTWTVKTTRWGANVLSGAVTQRAFASSALADAASAGHAIAVSFTDKENLSIAVEQTSGSTRKVTYYTQALPTSGIAGPAMVATGIVHQNTALVGQGAILAGTPTDTLVSAGADPLSPGFRELLLGADVTTRSGWIVFAPRTSEIVARAFVGYTGDLSTRSTRPPKGSMIIVGDLITWAGPASVPSDPSTTLRSIAVCKLDRTARANKPAVIDQTAVSAHAGYARASDGTDAYEHDWHTLPQINAIASGVAGSTTTAGVHRVAAIWEQDDANGLRYQSAPMLDPGTVTSLGGVGTSGISITVEPMSHTERSGVKLVMYMTIAGGATYFRAAEAAVTGLIQTITANVSDGTLATRETLQQAPVPAGAGVLPSLPGRVTDFVALLVDRLASRDPRVGSLMTFTTPSQEATGYATHWPGDAVQEPLERDVTSALEMDGRIVIASELGLAQVQQDGPDATGVGTFGIPLVMRAPIGVEDHAQTERTPLGYAFGSTGGPRLLSPGLTVEHIDEQVERQYSINGGQLVAIAFDPAREEIVWLDSEENTLRLSTHSGRWASDTGRVGRDLTMREDGVIYILRDDGKVLRQSETVFADGASGYPTNIAFRVRAPSRDNMEHPGFDFNGLEIFGEYVGPHSIKVTITLDFRDSTVVLEGTIPQVDVVANAAAGRDYRYVLYTDGRHCYAARCEVELSSTTGETARIAGIDVRYNNPSSNPSEVSSEQQIPLDVSNYS
jgi:hypothetical protein